MNPQSDWQRRLQELELDIDRHQNNDNLPNEDRPNSLQTLYQQARTWFQNLPPIGQVAVGIGGIVLGFSILQTLLRLVSLAISVAILAVLVYGGYRLFFASGSSDEPQP
ncbi:hypothetical protein [Baaleninema simplex]|uniref:hypothetical protein n=1 Tax=Baaleninema simplex TaxID=2862350 RepID=UPI00034D9F1D|nr:hypothetical protein [Baaleninema simplex]